jgi:hypothetical protein
MSWGKATLIGLAILLGIWVIWHPIAAESQKGNPPLTCQLFGGQWNLWSGWHCGTLDTPAPAPDTNTPPAPDIYTPTPLPAITGNTSSPYPNQTDNNGLPCGSSVGDCTEP